jgi:hypothetical protein
VSDEPGMLDATVDEMAEIARSRTLATGRVACVVAFTGSDRARIMDTALTLNRIDADTGRYGRGPLGLVDHGTVLLMHPSPGVADRVPPSPEADDTG